MSAKILAVSLWGLAAVLFMAPVQAQQIASGGGGEFAPKPELNATEYFSGDFITFNTGAGQSHYTLTISGPDGYYAQVFSEATAPALQLSRFGEVPDGVYTYTLTAASFEYGAAPRYDNGRDSNQRPRIGVAREGRFQIQGGVVTPFMAASEEN